MKYQVIYTKANPMSAWRSTLTEAQSLAAQMSRYGYEVGIWEHSEDGAHQIH